MKCINCKKQVNIVLPGEMYIHSKSQKAICSDGYGYADPGLVTGKVFGGK